MLMTFIQEKQKQIDDFITNALIEDIGDGDHTSLACIPTADTSTAKLYIKDPGIIAGVEIGRQIFTKVDPACKFDAYFKDGQAVSYGDVAFQITGNTQAILKAERLVLNTMQRMSGIATLSNRYKFEVEDLKVTILDTAKPLH